MRLIVADNYDAMSRSAADELVSVITNRPLASVMLATGNTPMGLYQELANRRRKGQFDASRLRVFQLDEYLGLGPNDRRSLYGWMLRSFVEPLGISIENVVRLPTNSDDPDAACAAFEKTILAAGGIDVAILGLGPNGHLGFNEPPAAADSPTRVVDLTSASIQSNGPYWGGTEQVPRRALTTGMRILLGARQTLLVVSGAHKRDILSRTVSGPITPNVPASLLQTAPNVVVLADRAAWGNDVSCQSVQVPLPATEA